MNFLNVNFLLWLPVVIPVMLLVYWWATVRRRKLLGAILGCRAFDPSQVSVNYPRRHIRFGILCLIASFLIIAMARPWWGMNIVPYEARGRDLVVVFDVSKSMLAEDIKPSRLAHAKWLVRELTSEPTGDRYGLIAFAGEAFLECPLTRDMSSFNQYIDELSTDSIPLQGTNLQRALETALRAFESAEGGHRAIILITDGEELEGDSTKLLDELKTRNIPLFIVGMGDPAVKALIPNDSGKPGFKRDSKGELVKTQLNEKLLMELRQTVTGSIYIRSTVADPGIEALKAKITALTPEKLENSIRTRPVERFQYFIVGALALLLIWMSLSERIVVARRRRKVVPTLFVGIMLAFSASAQQPLLAPEQKVAEEPKSTITPSVSKPEAPMVSDPAVLYNLGREAQVNHKDGVINLYEQAINSSTEQPLVRSRAFHNLGVLNHEKAREVMQKANSMLEQNLDSAEKEYANAQKLIKEAEDFYLRAIEDNTQEGEISNFASNQQQLLLNRSTVDEVKKEIKEYKGILPEAIKNLKDSITQHERETTNPSLASVPASDKIRESYDNVSRLHTLANKLQQQSMAKDSGEAAGLVSQALREKGQKVDELLKKALTLLEKQDQQKKDQDKQKQDQDQQKKDQDKQKQDQDKQKQDQDKQKQDQDKQKQDQDKQKQDQDKQKQDQDKQKQDQDKQDQDKQDQDKQDQDKDKNKQEQDKDKQEDKPLPPNKEQEQAEQAQKGEEQKLDPEQAKKLLELMAKDEKNLRDALKKRRMKGAQDIKVEKDW